MGKRWTSEDEAYLMDKWGSVSIPAIAKALGRTVSAIKVRVARMGLGAVLASGDYAILSAWINGLESAEDTLAYHAQETADNYDTDLAVFQLRDCYATLDDARDGLKAAEETT